MRYFPNQLASLITLFAHQPYLGHLPKELNDALQVAAGRGFLYAFLCQLDNDFLHPYLRRHGFNEAMILSTELTFKSMLTLWFGAGLWKGAVAPLSLYFLMTLGHVSREMAALGVAGFVFGIEYLLSTEHLRWQAAIPLLLTSLMAMLGTAGGLTLGQNRFTLFSPHPMPVRIQHREDEHKKMPAA